MSDDLSQFRVWFKKHDTLWKQYLQIYIESGSTDLFQIHNFLKIRIDSLLEDRESTMSLILDEASESDNDSLRSSDPFIDGLHSRLRMLDFEIDELSFRHLVVEEICQIHATGAGPERGKEPAS